MGNTRETTELGTESSLLSLKGIGKARVATLEKMGIKNVAQLRKAIDKQPKELAQNLKLTESALASLVADTQVEKQNSATSEVAVSTRDAASGKSLHLAPVRQSFSLLAVVGIGDGFLAKLNSLKITEPAALLEAGKTSSDRDALARKLGINEKRVYLWLKQLDLWRVGGMTPDMAYLLVQMGVRCIKDFSRLDVELAYPILESLSATQPDFSLVSRARLETLVGMAQGLVSSSTDFVDLKYADGILEGVLSLVNEKFSQCRKRISDKDFEGGLLSRKEIQALMQNKNRSAKVYNKLVRSLNFVLDGDDPEPSHILKKDSADGKTSGDVVRAGLGSLKSVPKVLPLPRTVSGIALQNGKSSSPMVNAFVEVSGVVSPSDDEGTNNPSGYTDGDGKFIIVMPDTYSLQETVTLSVSQGGNKQKFVKNASDIINGVPEQHLLDFFHDWEALQETFAVLDQLETKSDFHAQFPDSKREDDSAELDEQINEYKLKRLMDLVQSYCDKLNERFGGNDGDRDWFGLNAVSDYLTAVRKLDALLEALLTRNDFDAFVDTLNVLESFFDGSWTDNSSRTLPSVKLMGNDEKSIYLSPDSTPSRVFHYGMLQRLVEPAISGIDSRTKLDAPVDVAVFKESMYTDPDSYPHMVSLGIGYVLDMHQAWIPDGFSLGSLLYSMILAPGEEQRLIVREKTQSYTVTDVSEGEDTTSENYLLSQEDDTTAAYNYALNQLSQASSSYSYKTKTSSVGGGFGLGAIVGPVGGLLGMSGSYSKASGNASSSSRQSNSHNEASSAAQSFQHCIKSASDRICQSKRISMSSATGSETDSVATKIIANHNHSHAMTIQYWEVMQRYRLQTCVDGVELVVFVPLKLVLFLPKGQAYNYANAAGGFSQFNRNAFNQRYQALLKYADALRNALPSEHRSGLKLIEKYAAYPKWTAENAEVGQRSLYLTFSADLLTFDDIDIRLRLKNGRGFIAGEISYTRQTLATTYETSASLQQAIRDIRNGDRSKRTTVVCSFSLSPDVTDDELSSIQINYSCEGLDYYLHQNFESLTDYQKEAYNNMLDKWEDFAQDDKKSSKDLKKINHYMECLPEAYTSPNVHLSSNELKALGVPTVSDVRISFDPELANNASLSGNGLYSALSGSRLYSSLTISISSSQRILRYAEFQKMEALLHHVASNELHYSQVVWASLTEDERAFMLEQYTIDMDFEKMTDVADDAEDSGEAQESIDIPLLNCVNVKKVLGFYGNCILLPFTYPLELAKRLGKTAAELQDALYRYHTNCFRAPSTTISLPTDGMIGEAVLGETNVSEKIDLTRFWNWKDSPIDSMNLDGSYLNSTDMLAGKTTKDISALNVTGAASATPVTVSDLLTALTNKTTPAFNNLTALEQLKEVLNQGTQSAATGRDKILDASSSLAKQALSSLTDGKKNEAKKESSDTNTQTNGTGKDSSGTSTQADGANANSKSGDGNVSQSVTVELNNNDK